MNAETSQTPTHAPSPGESPEAGSFVPVWMIVLLFMLLYWGAIYFEENGGWFDKRVYAPYQSAQQVTDFWGPGSPEDEILSRGKQLFGMCAVCHMENGVGNPGNGCPPLAGSEWVSTEGPGRIVRIVSKGLAGPVTVKGQVWATGQMMPVGDQMQGDEKQKAQDIAALVSYVRKTFGNASIVTPAQVEAIRAQIKDHNVQFTAEELLKVPANE